MTLKTQKVRSSQASDPVDLDAVHVVYTPEDAAQHVDRAHKQKLSSTAEGYFLIDPKNRRVVEGDRRRYLTSDLKQLLSITIIPLIVLISSFSRGLELQYRLDNLYTNGYEVQGTIVDTDVRTTTSGRGSRTDSLFITIRYMLPRPFAVYKNGVTKQIQVGSDLYDADRTQPLTLFVESPNFPADTVIRDNQYDWEEVRWAYIWTLGAAIVAIPLVGITLYMLIRERRLMKHGILIPGTLTGITTEPNRSYLSLIVDYEFISPTGERLERRVTQRRNDLRIRNIFRLRAAPRPGALPEPGAELVVLYFDDKLFRVL